MKGTLDTGDCNDLEPVSLEVRKQCDRWGTVTAVVALLALFSCLSLARFDEIHGQDEISHYIALSRGLFTDWYSYPDEHCVFSPHLYPLCQWGIGWVFDAVNSFTLRLTNLLFWLGVLGLVGWLVRGRHMLIPLVACALLPVAVSSTTIIDIDQGAMPFFTLLLVMSVVGWSHHGGHWRWGWWVTLCFAVALWCRLTTPLVLVPLLLLYGGLRHGWRGVGWLAFFLVLGGAVFHASWRLYGDLTGIDWGWPYRYLVSSFMMVTLGKRATGVGRLMISGTETVIWGLVLPFVLLLIYACWELFKGWKRERTVPVRSLYLLAGLWLLGGYCIFGGALFGFPKYQVCGYPLALAGLWIHGAERWHWTGEAGWRPWELWVSLALAAGLGVLVSGDPQLVLRFDLKAAMMRDEGIGRVLGALALRQFAYHVLLAGLVWFGWKRRRMALSRMLLLVGMGMNIGLLAVQTTAGYQRGYMYGDGGETRAAAAWIREGGSPKDCIVPAELQEAMEDHGRSGKAIFFIDDLEKVRERLRGERPALVSVSWLCYPVKEVQAFLADEEIQDLLKAYDRHDVGHYLIWKRKE